MQFQKPRLQFLKIASQSCVTLGLLSLTEAALVNPSVARIAAPSLLNWQSQQLVIEEFAQLELTQPQVVQVLFTQAQLTQALVAQHQSIQAESAQPESAQPELDLLQQQALDLRDQSYELFEQRTATAIAEAVATAEQALNIWQDLGDVPSQIDMLQWLGILYQSQSDYPQSLSYQEQALELSQQIGDRLRQSSSLKYAADAYGELGQFQDAIALYDQALDLLADQGTNPEFDPSMPAFIYLAKAIAYSEIGEIELALTDYEQSLSIFEANADLTGQAFVLRTLGIVYAGLGQIDLALPRFEAALEIAEAQADFTAQAQVYSLLGSIYARSGEPQKALELYETARQNLEEHLQAGEQSVPYGYLLILQALAQIQAELGNPTQAEQTFFEALDIAKLTGDRADQAFIEGMLAMFYQERGELTQTIKFLESSLAIYEALQQPDDQAFTLRNLADVYLDLGEPQRSLNIYQQAQALVQAMSDRNAEAQVLTEIAEVYRSLGHFQLAVRQYQDALDIFRATQDQEQEAVALVDLGRIYANSSNPEQDLDLALEYYQQGLVLHQQQQRRINELGVYLGIAQVYEFKDQYEQGLAAAQQALEIAETAQNVLFQGLAKSTLGRLYLAAQQPELALQQYEAAREDFHTAAVSQAIANTTLKIGNAQQDLGQYQAATTSYQDYVQHVEALGDRAGIAEGYYWLARAYRAQDQAQPAIEAIEATLDVVETLRSTLVSQELRASYFATVQKYYEFYIDLLMQQHWQQPEAGYAAQALQVSERAKARSLIELLTEARAEIRQGVDPDLLASEQQIQQRLQAIEAQRQVLIHVEPDPTAFQALADQQETQLQALQQVRDRIRSTSPRYAALQYPEALSLQEIQQQVLDPDTVILQYSLGEERSYLWAIEHDRLTSYELPGRQRIETAGRLFWDAIPRQQGSQRVGQVLANMILEPAAAAIARHQRVVIVADGILHYVPFTALPDPNSTQMLIAEREVVAAPSSSTIASLRAETAGRSPAPKLLAMLADPVFSADDGRVQTTQQATKQAGAPAKESGLEPTPAADQLETAQAETLQQNSLNRAAAAIGISAWSPLPGTRREAEAILSLVPEAEQTTVFDFNASLDWLLQQDLSHYQILHFATHGLANTDEPDLSGLVFSLVNSEGEPRNGYLRLHDIFNLNLNAELVVLSACQTGLGKSVRGEGLVGLTRGFMYAGTPSVIVSLWDVDDAATAELMSLFYQGLLQDDLAPAAALRQAQVQLQTNPQWRSPYYWAAFTLQGDW
ncbi:MAG: CHAT domain-containing protein [Cyanobacteria bacterium P01_H01_bin.121]